MALIAASPTPAVGRTDAGVWLVNLGVASDQLEHEFDELCAGVEAMTRDPPTDIRLLAEPEHVHIKVLVQPELPRIRSTHGILLWVFNRGTFAAWTRTPELLQRLLWKIRLASERDPPLQQFVHVFDPPGPGVDQGIRLLLALGLEVRRPEAEDRVLAEVQRPDGVVCALLGERFPARREPGDDFIARSHAAIEHAIRSRQNTAALDALSLAELAELRTLLGPPREVEPVLSARQLRRALLAVADGAPLEPLLAELMTREFPLLMISTPDRGAVIRNWPGGARGTAAYPDFPSLHRSARDMNIPRDSYIVAGQSPRDLLAWSAEKDLCLMLGVFRDPEHPLYIRVTPEDIRALRKA